MVKAYGVLGLVTADFCWALGRLSLVTRRRLGLGGRAGAAGDPESFALDLLWGDLKAALRGELKKVRRLGRVAHAT